MFHQVLTLDSAGIPQRWSTWEEAITLKCKGLVSWSLGEETIYRGGNSRLTGLQSTVSVPSIIAIRSLAKAKSRSVPLTNRNLFGRDRYICGYCGTYLNHDTATRDHILATSRGGENSWMNCVTSCKQCNNFKDDQLLEKSGLQLLYAPYVPNRAEALILSNRNILVDQMSFLMAYLPKHSRIL